jgi:hypothetical protein
MREESPGESYPVLVADTFEVGKHDYHYYVGENGEGYKWKDELKMMGLAATQLMLDFGFKELHAKDSRVCLGLRQAFSNKQAWPRLMKLGLQRFQKKQGGVPNWVDPRLYCYELKFQEQSYSDMGKTALLFR